MSTCSEENYVGMSERIKIYAATQLGSFRERSRTRSRNRRLSHSVSKTNHRKIEATNSRSTQVGSGIEGFEELKQFVRKGEDVCKEIAAIISERTALELHYAQGLQRLATKLSKACAIRSGTTTTAWETLAEEMKAESETHKKIGDSLMEDICKPLRNMCDIHSKVIKPIEANVDKATRLLVKNRSNELKYKLKSFNLAAEAEKVHSSILERRALKKPQDKELPKLEKRFQVLKDQVRIASKKYYTCSIKSERSRQDWETTSVKSMTQLKQLEEERLRDLHKYLKLYKYAQEAVIPQLTLTCERINEAAACIDFDQDLRKVLEIRLKAESQPEQILVEAYAEDLKSSMDKERRRQALTVYLYYLAQDIETEKKSVFGVKKLLEVYNNQAGYVDREAIEETRLQARQVHAMLNFLDASHYKISKALSKLNGSDMPTHRLTEYMDHITDKAGLPLTYLRVPVHMIAEGFNEADFSARGRADGGMDADEGTYEELHADIDGFSDNDSDDEFEPYDNKDKYGTSSSASSAPSKSQVICTCKVLYDFNSTQSQELTVKQGDVINILDKYPDGWWKAELRGANGLIPESYVQVLH